MERTRRALDENRDLVRLLKHVTRVAIIDEGGRAYERWNLSTTPCLQDNGRTLKVFVSALTPESAHRRRTFGGRDDVA